MGIGANLQNMVSAEAAALAAVIVIIFGIQFWIKKETGKFIGAIIILAVCLTFIIDPGTIVTFLTGLVKKILGSGGTAAQILYKPYLFAREVWGGMAA